MYKMEKNAYLKKMFFSLQPGPMMMGQMGGMPTMQTGQMMPGQNMGQMGVMGPPAYNMAATQGVFNMQPPQQAVANQQFQQVSTR